MDVAKEEVECVIHSLQRCLKKTQFIDRFCEIFISSSEEISKRFKNVELSLQKLMLKNSLQIMVLYASGHLSVEQSGMRRLAQLHNRYHHDISPELYNFWLDSMVAAVKEQDTEFTPKLEHACRSTMLHGIEYMRSKY